MDFSLQHLSRIITGVAAEELLPRFAAVMRQHKPDGSVVTEADLVVQDRIAGLLAGQWPDTAFLGEEMSSDEQSRLIRSDQPVWCLDPLDGTSNFAGGIPYFCISLGLFIGGEVVAGVVYDPMRRECFSADRSGAFLNDEPLHTQPTGLSLKQTIALIDFKRLEPALAQRLVSEIPYASQRSFGSVALDWCWLAAGRGHLYLHGRSNVWDYAAGNLIFTRAGGHSCTLTGEPVFTQSLEKRSSVAAVDETLFTAWKAWLDI